MAFTEETVIQNEAPRNGTELVFEYLPAYAIFILENCLEEFVRTQIHFSREVKVPLLKFFDHLPEEQLLELAIQSSREFLTAIKNNETAAFIEKSSADYIRNRIPSMEREQVVALDITLISLVRRKTFRKFLTIYTTDFDLFVKIMEELDVFVTESESVSFSAFIEVQQEKIERKNQEIQQRHADLLEAQELANMGSFLWNMKDGKSEYTPGVFKIFELSAASKLDVFMKDVHEEDRPKLEAALTRALQNDGIFECEYRYLKNNKEKTIWSRGLVTFEAGVPVFMKGTVMDVTNKYQLLEQLQQRDLLYKQAEAITHIGNWSWDIALDKISWSDEMFRIYGLEPQSEQISFDRFTSLIHPDDRATRLREIQESLETRHVNDYQMRIINPDGTVKVLRGRGEVITDKNNQPLKLVGTCQDITLEYQLNQTLQEKEAYLSQLISQAPDAIIVIDKDSNITLWNPKTEEIFGWKAEEVLGKPLHEFIIPFRYHKAHKNGMKRLLETGIPKVLNKSLEFAATNKEGREIDISITISQAGHDGDTSFIAFLRDISNEKLTKAELSKKTVQLEKLNTSLAAKNTELERINKELESFNYVASHDLKEPLRKIQIFTNRILEKKQLLPAGTGDYFERIIASAARMQLLIEDLLMFSQATDSESSFEIVDLNQILREVENILYATIEEKNAIIKSSKLPVIKGIPFQLQQLFLNLVSNALKYSRQSVVPHITISSRIVKGERINEQAVPGKTYVEVSTKDNGIGFAEENAGKIFGIFQRLHSQDKYSGTGIGLAICKKIIQNHKGFICAKGTPAVGAEFCFYLPVEIVVSPLTLVN